jgi:hypothetical protein
MGLRILEKAAFSNCRSLKSLKVPDRIVAIEPHTFYACASIEAIVFGDRSRLKSIGAWAFCGLSSLAALELPQSVRYISHFAFSTALRSPPSFCPKTVGDGGDGFREMRKHVRLARDPRVGQDGRQKSLRSDANPNDIPDELRGRRLPRQFFLHILYRSADRMRVSFHKSDCPERKRSPVDGLTISLVPKKLRN